MTVYTLLAPMPPIQVAEGMILKLEAIDPTTGAAVGGVSGRNWNIYGRGDDDDTAEASGGPYMLVPGPAPVSSSSTPIVIRGGL